MKFFTRYEWCECDCVFQEQSLTLQQFKDDADVNNIVNRYTESPRALLMDQIHPRVPMFGDYSDVGDLQRNYNRVLDAQERFFSMPAKFRMRFANNPLNLLEFVSNPANRDEAIELGLIPDAKAPVGDKVASVAAVNAPVAADAAKSTPEAQL